jgi:carboxymethylenebutenolidase
MNESISTLSTSEGPMDLHCFTPDASDARRLPAVIVIQEAFGVNPHIKRVCRRVASAGYAVFSPELFHRTGKGLEFGYDEFPKVKPIMAELTNGRILEDVRAAHQHIIGRADVDPARVATWGFCLGGWVAMLSACELPISASVSFYGGGLVHQRHGFGFTPLIGRFDSIRCPVMLVFGARDEGIPPVDIYALRSRLASLGKDHVIRVLPEGGHGFFCEDRPAYHKATAEASWALATDWLASKLG